MRWTALLVGIASLAACSDYGVRGRGDPDPDPDSDTVVDTELPDSDPGTELDTEADTEPDTDPPDPEIGCADGAREGFLDLGAHPSIAGCAGAWTVGGVTRAHLVPTCGRAAGDDGSHREGTGCSAADVCAPGWHVCEGKTEVALRAPGGCGAAVPAGAPDKSLFFAVQQHSQSGSVCDDARPEANDVFGCGNLGNALDASKNCGPLNRVLASTQANSCGFNEAEPNLGPWQCNGGSDSHLMEGSLVTKAGCPGSSCSYDGQPVGNSDKGGVLCCRD